MPEIPADVSEEDLDGLTVQATFTEEAVAGELYARFSGEEECEDGEECSVWAGVELVGSWPPEE